LEVSVVICAKNAEKTLEQCLESVRKNNPSEIIVVDDGSTDKTVEISRRYANEIYFNEGKGLSYARQLGAEKASHNYVFYVDSDVTLTENCLAIMLEEMEKRRYAGIHAQVVGLRNTSYWDWAEDQHFRLRFNKEGPRNSITFMAGIYRKDIIVEHRFDPFFAGAGEDGDLCRRLRKSGLTLGISSAFVYHLHRDTARGFIKQRIWYGKGNARIFWKYKSLSALFGVSAMIPFGIIVCIRKRSPKMLPYYLVWTLASAYGTLSELTSLTIRRLMPNVPK